MSAWLFFILGYQLFISFFAYGRKTKRYQDHPPEKRFLVLVPAHNEEAVISGIIDNLQHMEYPKELYDFYILADNCDDRTVEVARSMGANVLESRKESPDAPTGKPIVLQKALETLDGYQNKYDLVMFFDADNLMDRNMFAEVNSQFLDNPDADVVQCYLGCKNGKGLVARFYYMSYTITNRFFDYGKNRLHLNNVIGGTGFAVRADYLHQRGGWTAMSLTEDFELQVEATTEGRHILWNQNTRIYDEKPTKLRASYRQRVRWAQGHWYVAFKNTGRLFQALFSKKITFGEFLSTFVYMYSLTPFVILVLQIALNLLLQIFTWTGLIPPEASVTQSVASWWLFNMPSILVFVYSFFFLFYYADWIDNGKRFDIRTLPPLFVSLTVNTVLVAIAQIAGLLKHKQQNVWVKTTHEINAVPVGGAQDFMPSLQASIDQAKAAPDASGLLGAQRSAAEDSAKPAETTT